MASLRRPAGVPVKDRARQAAEGGSIDDAWRTLSLLVELIKHAETKAAAALASAGLLGGILCTVIGRMRNPSVALIVVTGVAAGAIIVSGLGAGIALRPRSGAADPLSGLLFFRGIAQRFPDDADGYAHALQGLLCDRPALLVALSHQIWHNAHIATRKYRATNIAMTALLVALVMMTSTAILGVLTG